MIHTVEELSVEEIHEMLNEQAISATEKKTDDETSEDLTSKDLSSIIGFLETAIAQSVQVDPIMTRGSKFKHECESAMQTYRDLYKSMVHIKQTRMGQYLAAK